MTRERALEDSLAAVPFFTHHGHRIAYRQFGTGPRAVVLVHGLLLSKRMHEPLAHALAERGNRVITLDLLGHGESDRPADMTQYSMTIFAEQTVALLDHLEIPEAVVLGTSLGANTTLELAAIAPERLRGMVIEMPVLDGALIACALVFTPPLVGLTLGRPLARLLARGARAVPRHVLPFLLDIGLDVVRQDPEPSGAVLQGLFFGRIAPPRRERLRIPTRTLVIGHRRDPVHPFSDAGMLADELPNARLLEADSILELRIAPERLTSEIAGFIDACWTTAPAERRTRARGTDRAAAAP